MLWKAWCDAHGYGLCCCSSYVPPFISVNLFCLNTQAQRGLVCNTGDHRDPVITHLIEVGEVRTGDGTNEYDFVGLGANAGLVGDRITDLDVLQLGEIGDSWGRNNKEREEEEKQ